MDEKDQKPWCLCDPGFGPHDKGCPAALRYREQTEKDQKPERWECGPHTNAWGGHDARCRRVSVTEKAEYDQDRPAICAMCDHPDHANSECGEETGYDHLNGFHECGCPGSFREQLAQAWDEGREHGMDEDLCRLDLNPYRVTSPGGTS